jgi:2-dehydropantoate 2-reductase
VPSRGAGIAVIGAGAIGGIVAARLVHAGADVTLVEADELRREAIRERGLTLTGASELTVQPAVVAPGDLTGRYRIALVAVKCRQTGDALAVLDGRLEADGVAVSLQNGFELYRFAERFGTGRAVGAVVTVSGYVEDPGTVVHSNVGDLTLGHLDGRGTAALGELAELLSPVCPVNATGEIRRALWSKAVLGAVWFATALVDEDVEAILERDEYLGALGALAAEVAWTGRAEGVECFAIDGFDPRAFLTADVASQRESWQRHRAFWRSVGQTRTGVWRDLVVHRRRTEVACIVAPVLDFSRRAGREPVRVARLVQLIEEVENGVRGLSWENLDELVRVHETDSPLAL